MGTSVGNFYMQVEITGLRAVLLVTSRGEWKLIKPGTVSWWAPDASNQKGSFHDPFGQLEGFVECYGTGNPSWNLFNLSSLHFGALDLGQTPERFSRRFVLGKDWFNANPRSNVGAQNHIGHWFAIVTGPLLEAAKAQLIEAQKEFHEFCIDAGLTAASFVDPTGISAVWMAERASERGDYLGCALALVAVIPVARQVAAAGKAAAIASRMDRLLIEMKALENALRLSTQVSRDFRLGSEASSGGEMLRAEVQTERKLTLAYSRPEAAETAAADASKASKAADASKVATTSKSAKVLEIASEAKAVPKPIGGGYISRIWSNDKWATKEVSGDLMRPSTVPWRARIRAELEKVSKGTREHAGHLVGKQFGGPECPENLSLQNPNMNTYSPKAIRNAFYCKDGGGNYLQFENDMADMLDEGWSIHIKVQDKFRIGEARAAYRNVEVTGIPPGGGPKITKDFTFGNFSSPQSRGEFIPKKKNFLLMAGASSHPTGKK